MYIYMYNEYIYICIMNIYIYNEYIYNEYIYIYNEYMYIHIMNICIYIYNEYVYIYSDSDIYIHIIIYISWCFSKLTGAKSHLLLSWPRTYALMTHTLAWNFLSFLSLVLSLISIVKCLWCWGSWEIDQSFQLHHWLRSGSTEFIGGVQMLFLYDLICSYGVNKVMDDFPQQQC